MARHAVLIAGITVAVVLGWVLGSEPSGAAGGWACHGDRIGRNIVELGNGDGYATREEALERVAENLGGEGIYPTPRYRTAMARSFGPDRLEWPSGTLYIDDAIVAEITVTRLSDQTWSAYARSLCMRPPSPSNASPFPSMPPLVSHD